jgi:hypothetical protein
MLKTFSFCLSSERQKYNRPEHPAILRRGYIQLRLQVAGFPAELSPGRGNCNVLPRAQPKETGAGGEFGRNLLHLPPGTSENPKRCVGLKARERKVFNEVPLPVIECKPTNYCKSWQKEKMRSGIMPKEDREKLK